jgi:hypothetical protein
MSTFQKFVYIYFLKLSYFLNCDPSFETNLFGALDFLNDFALSFFTMRVPDEGNSRKNVVHTELDIDSGVGFFSKFRNRHIAQKSKCNYTTYIYPTKYIFICMFERV